MHLSGARLPVGAEGRFRTDLSVDWLVTVVYSLFHATAEAVNDGRLERADAADVPEATILPVVAAGPFRAAGREPSQ